MTTTTSNLKLFKYVSSTDSNLAFNITSALNNNWDIIDSGVALSNHTHSGYALTSHTHSGYASSNHTHSGMITATKSLSENGYIKFDNGFQIDWGKSSGTAKVTNVSLPLAFATKCIMSLSFFITATGAINGTAWNDSHTLSNYSFFHSSSINLKEYIAVGY